VGLDPTAFAVVEHRFERRRALGLGKRVRFHGLRHAHAQELARERMPLNQIQLQLGHANLATTHAYLDRIAPQEVIDTIQTRDWTL
jgi:integrase/recombinase XerD